MKTNPHKACSCKSCRLGRSSAWGRAMLRNTERKFRYAWGKAERDILTGADPDNYGVELVSTPFTD